MLRRAVLADFGDDTSPLQPRGDFPFLVSDPVELVNQFVNLGVGGGDFSL